MGGWWIHCRYRRSHGCYQDIRESVGMAMIFQSTEAAALSGRTRGDGDQTTALISAASGETCTVSGASCVFSVVHMDSKGLSGPLTEIADLTALSTLKSAP
eukprot:GFYU01009054.1.p1 GENE.GFYU01009054.1~~GFYU01009054.1.p1  ORF type:complete len:101 (+),score=17.01 GFYU01009054.1:74-376(+)